MDGNACLQPVITSFTEGTTFHDALPHTHAVRLHPREDLAPVRAARIGAYESEGVALCEPEGRRASLHLALHAGINRALCEADVVDGKIDDELAVAGTREHMVDVLVHADVAPGGLHHDIEACLLGHLAQQDA